MGMKRVHSKRKGLKTKHQYIDHRKRIKDKNKKRDMEMIKYFNKRIEYK